MNTGSKILSLTALMALAVTTSASALPSTFDLQDDPPPPAEVNNVEHGEGYVVIYPESNTPPEGQGSDLLPTGDIDQDTTIIVADEDGSLPMGLSEPEEILEAQRVLTENGFSTTNEAGALDALEESGIEVTTPESESKKEDASLPAACYNFVATAAGWSNPSRSTVAVFGSPGYVQGYTFHPTVQDDQQLIAGQGLGYQEHQTGGHVRYWEGLGSAYTGQQAGGTASWGNVIGNPEFRAQSVNLLADGSWCH